MKTGMILLMLLGWSAAADSELCQKVRSELQDGDLIFINIKNQVFKKVARATMGWTSHVGIARFKENEWWVGESTIPEVQYRKLCPYVDRTDNGDVAVRRFYQSLSQEELARIFETVDQRLGIRYGLGFDLKAETQFCSKLVYQAYKNAVGVELGRRETFRDLVQRAKTLPDFKDLLSFWNLWYFGRIPWERVTVTPHSQYIDDKLVSVIDTTRPKQIGHPPQIAVLK